MDFQTIITTILTITTALSATITGADTQQEKTNPENNLQLGSSHEHAQFFININNTEINFTQKQYQLNSPYVHLENYKPHIVHKHSENVTWKMFLETIEITKKDCLTYKNQKLCDNYSIYLNKNKIQNLTKEIEQGDNLAIISPKNKSLSEKYMEKKLPMDYTKKVPGKLV